MEKINHQKFINRCYQLAEIAKTQGESPVGSLVVLNEEIIGEGIEKSKQLGDVTRHAEVVAILEALKVTKDLSQATIYSNVEPCTLCSYVIRHHKIKEVVFANFCGELGGVGGMFKVLISAEVKAWNKPPKSVKWK